MPDTATYAEAEQVARTVRWLTPAQRITLLTGVGALNTCTNLHSKGLTVGIAQIVGEGRSRWAPVLSPLGEAVKERLVSQG